ITKMKDKCPQLGSMMPSILSVDSNNIVMTRIKDCVNVCQFLQSNSSDEELVDKLLLKLGQIIALIHNTGIAHGDLTTSNFLIQDNDPDKMVPIDFGLSSSSTSTEDRAVDLYVLERAILSTHPDIDFNKVLQSYDKYIDKSKKDDVLKRLDIVRQRGR